MNLRVAAGVATLVGVGVLLLGPVQGASAAPVASPSPTTSSTADSTRSQTVTAPTGAATAPTAPKAPASTKPANTGTVTVDINGPNGKPSSSIVMLIALTVLSVAPALLLLCTSFTKIIVVLSLTRNALGLTSMPPNQVLAGLALFLSMFIMGPVMHQVYDQGVQPYMNGKATATVAFEQGVKPLHAFMAKNTRKAEIATMTKLSDPTGHAKKPKSPADIPLTTLIPAFVLSELRAAFIIGFVVFVPFLVIDMIVSASLMSMGMMMLPPVTISLPFKLLLFVLVNGWSLVATALVHSYHF